MNRMFIHTAKAIRNGCPADRVLLVTGQIGKELLAWKCILTGSGLQHPGYKSVLSVAKLIKGVGSKSSYPNGSEPTALFKLDSFYKEISIEDLKGLIKAFKGDEDVSKKNADKLVALVKGAEAKLTQAEREAIREVVGYPARYAFNDASWKAKS